MPPTLISLPSVVEAAGNKPKIIREYIGRVNSATSAQSIAQMQSPGGWLEPGQTLLAHAGEWIQHSTPEPDGAFSPDLVHRDNA